jgi:hypothetical protein
MSKSFPFSVLQVFNAKYETFKHKGNVVFICQSVYQAEIIESFKHLRNIVQSLHNKRKSNQ